jgi:hypothetical protein
VVVKDVKNVWFLSVVNVCIEFDMDVY